MINVYETKLMKKYLATDKYDKNPNFKKHNIKTRKHILVCGKTGSGKTNFLVNLIFQFSNTFKEIYIFTAMPDEKLYLMLNDLDNVHVDFLKNIIPYDELEQLENKLIVFDDFIGNVDKKINALINDYAKLSRKIGCSCVFLTQSFFGTSLFLRSQCSYYVMLKNGNKQDLKGLLRTINTKMDIKELSDYIEKATEDEFNVVILDTLDKNKPIRRNFNEYLKIE